MALAKERLLKVYKDMFMIRRFEEVIQEYAANGTIPGFVHLSIGQEACQAGVVEALQRTDYKFPDHRGHGAIALCGTDPKLVMAEIFAKATGINGGRGGSMHVNDLEYRNMGFNGIQGSTMVTCLGTAFASVYNKTKDVTAVFLGDGTLGEGACHESLNLAATWKLPVLYCLVNNQYAISTNYHDAHPQQELKTWGEGYEIPSCRIDGNDVEAVIETVEVAAEHARNGEGPALIEMMTYRWQGHFAGDPAAYRPEEEVAAWKAKDPVKKTRGDLMQKHGFSEEALTAIEAGIEADIAEMLRFSLESPAPKIEEALTFVYADREVEA
ncbi:MAG: thiamine pyrophosphate-dependent dehydrogenase E1 component subunit alpha [Christensenellaceae bacterium]|jgi:pyruvate dehydrogenase E1 component alpha subunit|nr:thiamine pyrophosphate-dependent dehydrogenase E1 component subunit alpha [Christensenellaceae bacterium]